MVAATGALNTRLGSSFFEAVYHLYKSHFEAGSIELLRTWIRPRTTVIDVGANIGFFTVRFGAWVSHGGKVIAIEPEETNFARLQRAVRRFGLASVVETVQVGAADMTAAALLAINKLNPADHKLGVSGVPISVTTIDDLLEERRWPEVSLIKIDVQGAEAKVLVGAAATIARFRPTLFIEVYDEGLRHYGSSAAALLESITALRYSVHVIDRATLSPPLSLSHAEVIARARGYADFLCCPS